MLSTPKSDAISSHVMVHRTPCTPLSHATCSNIGLTTIKYGSFGSRYRLLAAGLRHTRLAVLTKASPTPQQPQISDTDMVTISVVFYGAMTLAGIKLGSETNVGDQLFHGHWDPQGALAFLTPLIVLFSISLYLSERTEAFKELKDVFQKRLIPDLKKIPLWVGSRQVFKHRLPLFPKSNNPLSSSSGHCCALCWSWCW